MNNYKFRAYWEKQGLMVEVVVIDWEEGLINRVIPIDEVVLMQYTGIDDKNGRPIYEGDIVKSSWGYSGEVTMEGIFFAKANSTIADDIEVVNNIYDDVSYFKYKGVSE